jgi:hypothetical protein
MEPSAFLTDKHLYFTFQDDATLVKGVCVARILETCAYFHTRHDQILPQLRFAHDPWSELFQL